MHHICPLTPHTSRNTPVYEYRMQDTIVLCFIGTLKRAEGSDSIIKSNINLRRGIAPSRRGSTGQYVVRDKMPGLLAKANGAIRSQIRVTDRCTRRNNIIPGAGIYHTPPPPTKPEPRELRIKSYFTPCQFPRLHFYAISPSDKRPDCVWHSVKNRGVFSLVNKDVNKERTLL